MIRFMRDKLKQFQYMAVILTGMCCLPFMGIDTSTASWDDPIMADYTKIPPFITNAVQPNVIVALDISGSMKAVAYRDKEAGKWSASDTIHDDFDPNYLYFGYFNSTRNYAYDGADGKEYFFESSTGGWDGNFLNWLSMRRMDVVRKVLTGGKVTMRVKDLRTASATHDQVVPVNRHLAKEWIFAPATTPEDWDGKYVLEGQNEPFDRSFKKSEDTLSGHIPSFLDLSGVDTFTVNEGEIRPQVGPIMVRTLGDHVEIGTVTTGWDEDDAEWLQVTFANTYSQPRVVVKSPGWGNNEPLADSRIRWDTPWPHTGATHFYVRLQEWEYQDGDHTDESITYLVVESDDGTGSAAIGEIPVTMDSGAIWHFKANHGQETVDSANCGRSGPYQTLTWEGGGLSATPVVFAGVGSYYDTTSLATRIRNVNLTTFELIIQKQEIDLASSCIHTPAENLHVIAVIPDGGASAASISADSFNGLPVQAGLRDGITHVYENSTTNGIITYDTSSAASTFSQKPIFIGDMQTSNGSDPGTVRVRGNRQDRIKVRVHEEQSSDDERGHSAEQVGWLAVEGITPFKIRVGVDDEPTGILQDISTEMRLGLAVYNYDHAKPVGEIYNNNDVHGGTMIPSYPDFSKPEDEQTTLDIELPCGVHDPVQNIYRVVEEHPLIWGTTPIAETLIEIQRYIQQDGTGTYGDPDGTTVTTLTDGTTFTSIPGGAYYDNFSDPERGTDDSSVENRPSYPLGTRDGVIQDPYYYPDLEPNVAAGLITDAYLECAQTFVLHFNDGAPFEDWDDEDWSTNGPDEHPAVTGDGVGSTGKNEMLDDVAYSLRAEDQRSDLDGHQEIISYYVYAALGEDDQYTGSTRRMRESAVNGGFVDEDGDHVPDPLHKDNMNNYVSTGVIPNSESPMEWDANRNFDPDAFFYANDGYQLVRELTAAFQSILSRVSSGTAASVISNSRSGEGAIYQSIFYPSKSINANTVDWVGQVHAMLVDARGNIREDTNNNAQLDPMVDKIIVFGNDQVKKYDDDGDSFLSDAEKLVFETASTDDIEHLWNSNDWLNELADPVTQRNYGVYTDHRYIFTFVDRDGNMAADDSRGEEVDFTATTDPAWDDVIDPNNFEAYIRGTYSKPTPPIATGHTDYQPVVRRQIRRIINFVRGQDQPEVTVGSQTLDAFRSRQIDYDQDGDMETWRMGDVVYSTPTLVGRPAEDFDLLYHDGTYTDFYLKYYNRRNVVYVGANDGMMHAFNGGFYDPLDKSFGLQSPIGSETEFPLGMELWGYVPSNLLPHLHWLTDPDYEHIYYVDLKPRIFDAKIFPDEDPSDPDTVHPNGWGTVLVGGMRFGGGRISTDFNQDGSYDAATDMAMTSAYFILDITDPESPPEVLAEITFKEMGFTTSEPGVIVVRDLITDPGNPTNEWYLLIGSGPAGGVLGAEGPNKEALIDGTSTQQAVMYAVDLTELGTDSGRTITALNTSRNPVDFTEATRANDFFMQRFAEPNSVVSKAEGVDWDLDFQTDTMYFGTSFGDHTNGWQGKMRRIVVDEQTNPTLWDTDSTLIDLSEDYHTDAGIGRDSGQPIMAPANATHDHFGNRWIYFGTGRYFSLKDTANIEPQSFYGIKEPYTGDLDDIVTPPTFTYAEVDFADVKDVSDILVYNTGSEVDDPNDNTITDFVGLTNKIESDFEGGWVLDLDAVTKERNLGQATLIGEVVTFSSFIPSSDPCTIAGQSYVYAVYFGTGTAYKESIMGFDTSLPANGAGEPVVLKRMSLGEGMTVTPNIHTGQEIGSTAFIQTSTGEITEIKERNPGITKSGSSGWKPDDMECP